MNNIPLSMFEDFICQIKTPPAYRRGPDGELAEIIENLVSWLWLGDRQAF